MFYNAFRQCTVNQYPYTVQPGDTLNGIAYRLEVSVSRIMAANPGLDPYRLQIGQVICIPACPPNHTPVIIQSGDTLYRIAETYQVSIESILDANPGVDPYYLRVGQRICIPSAGGPAGTDLTITAMQNDITMLTEESNAQQINEKNYGTSKLTTRVLDVTESQIRFDAVPVSFTGDYRGHYTAGQSYPYYSVAASGGQRGITVKDNFGVWHTFGYHVPIG